MKFRYDGKQIRSVHSVTVTFYTEQKPIEQQ